MVDKPNLNINFGLSLSKQHEETKVAQRPSLLSRQNVNLEDLLNNLDPNSRKATTVVAKTE